MILQAQAPATGCVVTAVGVPSLGTIPSMPVANSNIVLGAPMFVGEEFCGNRGYEVPAWPVNQPGFFQMPYDMLHHYNGGAMSMVIGVPEHWQQPGACVQPKAAA